MKANFRCRSTETCLGVTETCIQQTVSKIQENCRLSSVFYNKNENCVISSAPRICHVPSWHEVINIELFLYKKWLFYLIWLNKSTKGQTGHVHWRIDIKYIVMPAFSILNFKVFPPYFGDQFIPVGFESKNYIAKERNDV